MHWAVVKRILWYINQCINRGLQIHKSLSTLVSAFSYADWASSTYDIRSTCGFAVYLGSNLVSWSARKEGTVHAPVQSQNKKL